MTRATSWNEYFLQIKKVTMSLHLTTHIKGTTDWTVHVNKLRTGTKTAVRKNIGNFW